MDSEKLLLTIPEVSARLGLCRSLVYQLVMKGEIRSLKVGRARRVSPSALQAFVDRKTEEANHGV